MRAAILGWSAFSGLVLGLLAGIMAFAVVVLCGEMVPRLAERLARWRGVGALVLLVALPVAGAVIGLLEGRLKLQ